MSTDAQEIVNDRPYPFEIKARIMQLVGLAIGTSKDVADIHVDIKPAWDNIDVSVYVGGYDSKKSDPKNFSESLYLSHHPVPIVVEKLDKLLERIAQASADGRAIKAKRLRDQAAELLATAAAIEQAGNTPEKAT